ncbi:MAG: hypothetical protein MPEBLZ_00899 [Candidatus Methanoperedens nitroreducens]|uniref:Uncharacterized protein n=1 Tax=Candidatus Methanoperedens nitratireducens TaxID=1392998 RepID=A0A0P7ZKF8_9EURY|nr:hypothetical protein [Candidatus Methanoperedens sp. BLZ2]KAB2944352.1 MAG: hypothetical protein F9K14_14895 [Candidatus Methanoperedens sp.]KPQ44532.1 MAG: hypothetical protein MPEBLZ_00899 [Candidatus Methanoperedens sp. BLZ1]MBZ0175323.1 hypothetical protein [Candidatus Methanoperedens nitroreducens]CAG0975149.1 hypothetical protein METP2_01627 [Methanosarcinales archaeon]MCX9079466.1 hypothetical protein [Candidatus Methanoperedens sp.]
MRLLKIFYLTALLITITVSPVMAASTNNLTTLYIREDSFRNYDFLSETDSNTNVDWPVSMLFYNNADINKVKSIFFIGFGSILKGRLNDGAGWVWDSDGGTKGISSRYGHWLHMRVYADSDDRMYNLAWGYYVIGTTHYDEYPFESWSGYSEAAEEEFASIASSKGYSVSEDWSTFYNYHSGLELFSRY